MDLKENFAVNLSRYRKEAKLTQAELAEKLNYSDKAVSKWERGESVPDIYALKNIAYFFGTSVDALVEEPKEGTEALKKNKKHSWRKRCLISLCSVGIVWLVAICGYSFIEIIIPTLKATWLCFIYALPITFIVLTVLSAVWGKRFLNKIFVSCLIWTILAAVQVSVTVFAPLSVDNIWKLYLIGIPLQGLVVFWYFLGREK